MDDYRIERDSFGEVQVPADRLWGAQTQRSLEHFSIGAELIPLEMVEAYAFLKKGAALANFDAGLLPEELKDLICAVCDELLQGAHASMFPLHVWMTGSGTQFNMNVNEVVANRCSQLAGEPLGSRTPAHPNDHVNMSQSSNDTFPAAMCIAAALGTRRSLLPSLEGLRAGLAAKAEAWRDIVKVGRTHLQDATPLTLGQEFSGYAAMLEDNARRIEQALEGVMRLALGGTAVGTGINSFQGFDAAATAWVARLAGLPFVTAPNKFAVQGAHDDLVQLSSAFRTLAVSLFKIASDIRLLGCGPRAGIQELRLPANEPGSSIMPGKVNPTQCESLTMAAMQVMANDVAVGMGGAGGQLEMNVYKPLMIHNIMQSIRVLADSMRNFQKFLVAGLEPDMKVIDAHVQRSLMLVTALSPRMGYDKASQVAHHAMERDLPLKQAALEVGGISEQEFDELVNPLEMTRPCRKA